MSNVETQPGNTQPMLPNFEVVCVSGGMDYQTGLFATGEAAQRRQEKDTEAKLAIIVQTGFDGTILYRYVQVNPHSNVWPNVPVKFSTLQDTSRLCLKMVGAKFR